MKICNNCNHCEPDTTDFCSNCESRDFSVNENLINDYDEKKNNKSYDYTENTIDFYDPNVRKKKMFSMLGILAIILVVLVVFTAIKITLDNSQKDDIQNNNQTTQEEIAFSYGEFNGNIYHNNWADIKCYLDKDWKQVSKEKYDLYKDENTTCDFIAMSNDGSQIAILLIDLSNNQSLVYSSEDELIKDFSLRISNRIEKPKISENQYQMLGNQLYLYSDIEGKTSEKEICITSYIRKKDNYAIVVNISSVNAEKNHVLSEMIYSCE